MADIKEQRARVDKMEEERKNAVQAGASSLEEARAQAREDLRAEESTRDRRSGDSGGGSPRSRQRKRRSSADGSRRRRCEHGGGGDGGGG